MGEPARREEVAPRAMTLVARRENSLMSLFELSHELGVALDPFGIAQLTLFSLMGHFGTATAALWLLSEDEPRDAVLLRSFGLPEDDARRLGVRLPRGPASDATAGPAPVIQLADEGGADDVARAARELGLALLIPVSAHGRPVGLAALGTRLDGEPYAVLDLEYLSAAAGMVGVAIENTRLYLHMLESNRRLRESNERLAELDRLKSEFLQTVNHELRTPLSVIVGYLDVLHQAATLDETGRRAVTVATEQAGKLEGLLKGLLEFSEIQEDTSRVELKAHDLVFLLRGFAGQRRPGVVNGLREFSLEIEPALPRVRCDARRLTRALDAIVDNAVKFTTPGAHIRLRAERRGEDGREWVAVEVEDDGPGIAEEQLAALFEPFRQGDGSTTRTAGGLGLGLALVREIAERMGGRVVARSHLGQGSTFGLLLPPG